MRYNTVGARRPIAAWPAAVLVAVFLMIIAAACTSAVDGNEAAPDSEPAAEGDGNPSQQPEDTDIGSGPSIDGVAPPDPTPIDLSADLTIGQLDNGLPYYIQTNDSPGGQAELLLVVNAGSTQQRVPDSGGAHFLEHMMFNGTEEFPVNELDDVLRGLGVEIGPDLNAYTSFDETVYQLAMPTADEDNLELGFRVLAQWAGAATINQSDVEAERGVVREEFRVRAETGDAAIDQRLFEIYTQNSGYDGYLPIGSDELILATNAEELEEFYDDWYRPDNMAVIAVGDFDEASVERLIKQELSGLTDRGSSPPREQVAAGSITEPFVEVVAREGGPEPSISLDYLLPSWDPATVGGQRMLLADELIATMLNAYLNELEPDPNIDIIRPFVGTFPVARNRRFLGLNVAADDYGQGPTDLMRAMRTAQEIGFSQRHLDVATQQIRSFIDQSVAANESKQDSVFALEIVDHVLGREPLENIEAWAERTTDQLESFSLDELNRLFVWEMDRTAPLLALIGSDPTELPSQTELEAAVAAGLAGPVLGQADVVEVDQLVSRPAGPDPVEEGEIYQDLDSTHFWSYENGVTVLFWESDIAAGQVDALIVGGTGLQPLSEEESALATMAVSTVTNSGVAGVDQVTLERYLAGNPVSLRPFIDARFQGLSGRAASQDIDVLFELIHAYVDQPRADAGGLAVGRNELEGLLQSVETDPATASLVTERRARFRNEPNLFVLPTAGQIDGATADELLALFSDRFSAPGSMLVLVAGDVTADELREVSSDYLGSLPSGTADAPVDREPYPTGPERLTVGAGLNDSGAGFDRYYVLPGVLNLTQTLRAELVAGIINDRLFSRVREELGASYGGGNAFVDSGYFNSGETSFSISVNGDPQRLAEIMAAVDEELTTLMTDGPSDDDLAEAKAVLANDLQLINNFQLMERMHTAFTTGERIPPFISPATVQAVTANEVRDMARRLMAEENLIEVTRQPAE